MYNTKKKKSGSHVCATLMSELEGHASEYVSSNCSKDKVDDFWKENEIICIDKQEKTKIKVIKVEDEDCFGLPVFAIDKGTQYEEWVIGDHDNFYEIAMDKLECELGLLGSKKIVDFLVMKKLLPDNSCITECLQRKINLMQNELHDDAEPIIKLLLKDNLDEFFKWIIEKDGLGPVLTNYNDKIYNTKDIPGLNPGWGPLCFQYQ